MKASHCLTLLACLISAISARGAFPTLYLKPICLQQFHSPTNITHAGDGSGRLFITDQPGKIYVFKGGMLLPTPFLDITSLCISQTTSYSERGLLGLAFHPGYANSSSPGYRKFYVYYSKAYVAGVDPGPLVAGDPVDHTGVLSEFQANATNPDVADIGTERKLMVFPEPQSNHNGGQLAFGPESQGYLYFGLGDGGQQNDNNLGHSGGSAAKPGGILGNSQDRTRLYGKIIRIDPLGTNGPGGQYGIPADNPFVGLNQDFTGTQFDGPMRGEIWSFGNRNPWRFSFDKRPGGTNRCFCGDVGQNSIEEIDIITKGANYGWRVKEGTFNHDISTSTNFPTGVAFTAPIAQYGHPSPTLSIGTTPRLGLSVTGGFVYRGSAIPGMVGKYVFGDYGATSGVASGRMMGLEETSPNSGVFALTQALPIVGGNPFSLRINTLGEGEDGELYVGTKITAGVLELSSGLPAGGIYKIVPAVNTGTATLTSSRDTTLFSENENSDALGAGGFAGEIAHTTDLRRMLIGFDVSSIPPSTSVVTATVNLEVNKVPNTVSYAFTLHKVTKGWGEGTSGALFSGTLGDGAGDTPTTGDATWSFSNYSSTTWTNAGGDFVSTASATTNVADIGQYSWSSVQLAADVQSWVSTPSSNNGWILRGPETTQSSAKRFATREDQNTNPNTNQPYLKPQLVVIYGSAPAATQRETWLATYFPAQPVGFYLGDNDDADGDGIGNLIEYAYAFSPTSRNNASDGLAATPAGTVGGTNHNVTFRRDPRAVDLTYELQASTDLVAWTTIVTSTSGGAPTGSGFVSEATISGEAPVKLVSCRQTLPTGSDSKSFVRLRVTRAP